MRYAILGAAQLAVGAAAIFARFALQGAQPLAVSAGRLSIAAMVLLLLAAFRRGERAKVDRRTAIVLACAGIALALHFATWIASLDYTSVAISTLLVATTPVFIALYDALVHRRIPPAAVLLAFAAGGAGLLMVVGWSGAALTPRSLFGALLAVCGAVAIGAYFVLVRTVRDRSGTRTIVTHTYAWAAVALVAAAALARQPLPAFDDRTAWGGIVAMALVSQLLGHTAMNASLRWFSPRAVAFSTLLEPVCAAALAYVIFREPVSPLGIAGGAILLAAIAVVLRSEDAPEADGAT